MNIEYEVKLLLGSELLKCQDKVKLITEFTNFREEDIENAIKSKYGYCSDKIYEELLILDKIRKGKHDKVR